MASPPGDDVVIVADNLCKSFGGTAALSDVSFRIPRGECFGLIGPNGAGKTTLLRILTDIVRPDSGSVSVLGAAPGTVRRRIGYLPEERGLYRKQKVVDILSYLGRLKDLTPKQSAKRAEIVLEDLGMSEHAKSRIDSLSKGMAQRVQLAASLINDPEFVIFDEPFSGLDPVSAEDTCALIERETAKGRSILLSTHQMAQAERLCTSLLMLHRGRTVLSGRWADIRSANRSGAVIVNHDGPLTPLPGIEVQSITDHSSRLLLPNGSRADHVVMSLITDGSLITGFSVEDASLEDIFMQRAKASQ